MDIHKHVLILLAGITLGACASAQTEDANAMNSDDKKAKINKLKVETIPRAAGELGPGSKPIGKGTLGPGMEAMVKLATKDLATRMSIDPDAIEVLQAEFVTWPDSSMGCPQPGNQYMHVLTNGSRIVLRADGSTYHYHSGKNRPPFWCRTPSKAAPAPYSPGET